MIAAMLLAAAAAIAPGNWTRVADAPSHRQSGAMAPLGDGRVAYLGGSYASAAGNAPFSSAVAYDAKSDSWASLPDMQLPRDAPGACTLGGSLFAFGGAIAFPTPPSSQMTITNSVESLDLYSSSPTWAWAWAAPLPSNRTSPSVTALADGTKCVIAGGFSGVPVAGGAPTPGYLDDAYLFDGKSYSALPQLPFGRSNMGIAATSTGVSSRRLTSSRALRHASTFSASAVVRLLGFMRFLSPEVAAARTASRSPYSPSSLAAFLGPTPGTPGTLSLASPISASLSATCR